MNQHPWMSSMRFLIVVCSGLLSGVAFGARGLPVVGQSAPDFEVTTLDGKTLRLADFKGQVVVLNFWATWCEPCKKELPMLNVYYRMRQSAGLRVLAVTTEDSAPLSQLKPLAAALAIPMVRYFKGDYGPLKGVPTNYVIDRNGVLRYAQAGALTLEDLNTVLVPLLSEPAHDP
jgi:peroxiredoxin